MAALDTPEEGQLQLGYMKVAGEVVATFIGVMRDDRFSVLLSSITNGELRRWSPGLLLMRSQVQDLCRRGLKFYDLGVGEARHKSEWADTDVPLFDSFIGFGPMGKLAALPLSMRSRAKRVIKNEPHLWALVQRVRRLLRGRSGGQQNPAS
jgi:CelD/BcsL family acetyltransferase involved in cellulose biosynthesis